jgi:hypothetical protein
MDNGLKCNRCKDRNIEYLKKYNGYYQVAGYALKCIDRFFRFG